MFLRVGRVGIYGAAELSAETVVANESFGVVFPAMHTE
jgi:hypothetical protein